eukprot:TRINITY_DN20265_c0_g1_i2.p1 TRINITY_DN20265_c0_g1~~TRINITY_DN20265_c0_g1_i2.p1  ORF type:complete len:280 (+),score=-2.31 TRINITY_DN20265_c0_g1_i2:96-935(+)
MCIRDRVSTQSTGSRPISMHTRGSFNPTTWCSSGAQQPSHPSHKLTAMNQVCGGPSFLAPFGLPPSSCPRPLRRKPRVYYTRRYPPNHNCRRLTLPGREAQLAPEVNTHHVSLRQHGDDVHRESLKQVTKLADLSNVFTRDCDQLLTERDWPLVVKGTWPPPQSYSQTTIAFPLSYRQTVTTQKNAKVPGLRLPRLVRAVKAPVPVAPVASVPRVRGESVLDERPRVESVLDERRQSHRSVFGNTGESEWGGWGSEDRDLGGADVSLLEEQTDLRLLLV